LEFRRRKIPIFPRYSRVSGDFGVSFLTPDLQTHARMDLLDWFFSFSTAHNFNFNFGFSNEVKDYPPQ
jgi:hypothetical protein